MTLLHRILAPYRSNLRGWRTPRKIIVIESDDWGSIRMPSRAVYERCLKAGYPVDQTSYERYDSLLCEDDLEHLFGLLGGIRDRQGRPPRITANVIMGNPDFEAIAASGNAAWHWEPLTRTFARYPRHGRSLALWRDAMAQGLMSAQFHGREHMNVALFMAGLRDRDPAALFALQHGMAGSIPRGRPARPNLYVETTHFRSSAEKSAVLAGQIEGLDAFAQHFGFRSRTLIPTNYTWSSDFDAAVAKVGVEALQGAPVMKEQQTDGTSIPNRRHLGQVNAAGLTQLVRNAFFEPSLRTTSPEAETDHCLNRIAVAFRMHKPAVISCHRINFCGFIDPANRDRNLKALEALLRSVLDRWPDVEFLDTVELLDLIREDQRARV